MGCFLVFSSCAQTGNTAYQGIKLMVFESEVFARALGFVSPAGLFWWWFQSAKGYLGSTTLGYLFSNPAVVCPVAGPAHARFLCTSVEIEVALDTFSRALQASLKCPKQVSFFSWALIFFPGSVTSELWFVTANSFYLPASYKKSLVSQTFSNLFPLLVLDCVFANTFFEPTFYLFSHIMVSTLRTW